MNIVNPSVTIVTPINAEQVYNFLEGCGRTAYKSEDKISAGSAERFLKMIVSSGHESVLEHFNITVRIICDRGVTHELVRHRLAAYTQESTRYCNYEKLGFDVIQPPFSTLEGANVWLSAMEDAERHYEEMVNVGEKPEIARSVLPNAIKTEIVCTMNIRTWRHVLKQRTSRAAHPQINEIVVMILDEFKNKLPLLFGDIVLDK